MFYEQQKLVEKKTQSFEKNSATVIFKSDAKVVSSTSVVKQDAHTNTSPVLQNDRSNITFTRNSSIISMKTNKPEEEQPQMLSRKTLDVQKMPSVNIRPGFTIQHGPKINIVGSSVSSHKLKRKNTEFFDVVYPPSSPVFSESSFISDQGRQNKQTEYICDRHSFPSGRLVPGTSSENLRENHPSNLDEKREVLIELIKSVTEKVEKQPSRGNKSCCRLICSLPLLASVVRKIQVDCVKCVDLLNSHLDRLLVLMKEELRGNREISDNHCCQLDETVHYQIVELELIQEENKKRQTAPVNVVRHKDENCHGNT
ncbi:uncharacterized protein LOC128985922 [Macrosteles quadrilineatus]|uniref:uncharacterized protein LOC128985922 n=1 Tax=Macrosteles quadrilineatus TaxID=74068 RepID=UPI0023E0942C|nr:uncharacterized protein LOC128985922 [Macrosteles quadrilineatus]